MTGRQVSSRFGTARSAAVWERLHSGRSFVRRAYLVRGSSAGVCRVDNTSPCIHSHVSVRTNGNARATLESLAASRRVYFALLPQASYLVGVSDPHSQSGHEGLVDPIQFARAHQAIQMACQNLVDPASSPSQVSTQIQSIPSRPPLRNACDAPGCIRQSEEANNTQKKLSPRRKKNNRYNYKLCLRPQVSFVL